MSEQLAPISEEEQTRRRKEINERIEYAWHVPVGRRFRLQSATIEIAAVHRFPT